VYDGQTEQNPLIANYTFEDGKTPESIYSRSNYMFVKFRFLCTFPTNRQLQPIEIQQMQQQNQWKQHMSQQYMYEQKLYQYYPPQYFSGAERPWQENPQKIPPLSLEQMTFQQQRKQLEQFEKLQQRQELKFQQTLQEKESQLQQARIFCPYSGFDEITMYAMAGELKHPDLTVKNSYFVNNSMNGINATNLHSLIQLNETIMKNNHMNGLHVQGGAGDVSLYHCVIDSNLMNGVNMTYAGGLKEFNYTNIKNNGLFGIYANYDVKQELDNIFQNTTINSSIIESNMLGGVYLGSYCNQSNITVNASIIRNNQENGLLIESCRSNDGEDWFMLTNPYDRWPMRFKRPLNRTIRHTHLNISWCFFDSNRLNGLKISAIQNMIGMITNNTFMNHNKGALLITANTTKTGDSLIRNVSLQILFNHFRNNSGRYALNVALNQHADRIYQSINITFNRFEFNYMHEPFENMLNSRTTISAVAIVSSSNVAITQNWFDNPATKLQIATHLENHTGIINASYNWFNTLQPVNDLNYYVSNRDKCNQQWNTVRQHIFDQANRSNLAQIVYWPFACNDRLWYHESSIDLRPPADFDMNAVNALGGIFDYEATLPVNRYTVVNDITVKPGARLTLKSGTVLNFLNGVGMLVLGELAVEGVFSSPVRFTLSNRQQQLHSQLNMRSAIDSPSYVKVLTAPIISKLNSTSLKNQTLQSTDLFTNSTINLTMNISPKSRITSDYKIISSFSINLVDGPNAYDGRLRIEINGQHGTVCNRGWSLMNSQIVCQQMGLVLDPNFYLYTRWLEMDARQDEPILMSEVQCDLLDTSLFECRHTKRDDHTCDHRDDVWLKCIRPGWAGVRLGMTALPSRIKYGLFEGAGQYDYAKAQLAPALQIDLNQHEISNLTFQSNQHTSFEILFNQPFKSKPMNNIDFISNNGIGLLSRTSFLRVNQLSARNNLIYSAFEYNPYFDLRILDTIRLYSAEPRRGQEVRRELTRLKDNIWHIGSEQMVLLYTDVEYEFGPIELNIQIQSDNNRVLVVDLIDYNPNFEQEKVIFCEKFCEHSLMDPNSREWNLSSPSSMIFFPINTSYSVLHISYNVTSVKTGRLTFLVYTVKAPEPVFNYQSNKLLFIFVL
jgi:hypothetical protein